MMAIYRLEIPHTPDAGLKGCGFLVDDSKTFPIEIVRWPAHGWRAIGCYLAMPLRTP
jgi:hypothetical protein